MAHLSKEKVGGLIDFLENQRARDEDASLDDVMRLAEVMAESIQDFLQTVDVAIYRDFKEIAGQISSMKHEITNLRATEIRERTVPEAGRELDAIVEATETATHTIMEAAEQIMAADPDDADAYQDVVNARIMEIFEACSFQDITGQRISKVVETLTFIDQRVSGFVDRLKLHGVEHGEQVETEADRRRRELILHGPQHSGEGVSQDDIDRMMAENDSGQDAIDKLFA